MMASEETRSGEMVDVEQGMGMATSTGMAESTPMGMATSTGMAETTPMGMVDSTAMATSTGMGMTASTAMAPSPSETSLETPMPEAEKIDEHKLDLERVGESEGYILDEATLKRQLGLAENASLKKSSSGVVLIPQPSDDPDDPLNWPEWKKSIMLAFLSIIGATGDFGSASGAIALLPQAQEWHLSPNTINHATAGNVFMLGAGGLIVVWWSAFFGRLPVLILFSCAAFGTSIWCAVASSFHSYMAARILNGFFGSVAAGGGLMWIKDVYYFHQHPRKINIWATALILSPFLGPLFTALIVNSASWRWAFWMLAIICGTGLILAFAFGDETFYPRHLPQELRPARRSRLMRLIGLEQVQQRYTGNSFFGAGARPALAILRIPVFLSFIYYFFSFAFVISNNITLGIFVIPEYHFTYNNLAVLYVAPVLGAIIGQLSGHWLHDGIASLYAKRHGGRIIPECRLIILWFMTPLNILGLNLIGSGLQNHWNIYVIAVGWAIHNGSTVITTTAIYAYCLDSYPEASGEVAAWLNAARTFGGFVVGYVQLIWAQAEGTQKEFGIQSAIVGAVFFTIVFMQFYGARLRRFQGPLKFKTH